MTSQRNQFKAVENISYIVSKKRFFLMQNLEKVLLSLTYFKEAKYLLPITPPKNLFQLSKHLPSSATLTQWKSTKNWPSAGTPNKWCCAHIQGLAMSCFWHFWVFLIDLMTSSVDTSKNGPKIFRTENPYHSVTS